jgi:cytochrome bd ubiquinol oxidase subunit I
VVEVDPWGALFGNSLLWSELIHMYIAGYMVTGFVMAGAYAICRLRGRWTRYERVAMTIPLTIACLAAPVQVRVGDWIVRVIAVEQPIKLAAIEGLYRTTRGASEHILGWYTNGQIKYGIGIPHLLSLLAFHSWNARVAGLEAVSANQRPPINVTRLSFRRWSGSARRWRCSASSICSCASAAGGSRSPSGSTGRSSCRRPPRLWRSSPAG